MSDTEAAIDVLAALAAWVVKDGVALGGLSFELRTQALAVAWAGLPAVVMSENEVNGILRAQLAGAASFLATDHVELRRWLVDAAWLRRDGYGREYRRVPVSELAAHARVVAEALSVLDVTAWVTEARLRHVAQRDQHRQAWQTTQSSSAGSAA